MPKQENDSDKESKDFRPPTLLTVEEMAAGNIKFVELVKLRDKLIQAAKKAKGISDGHS